MESDCDLYESFMIKGSYFNEMLDCGREHNCWLQLALTYLPEDVLDKHKESFLFTSTATRDACRVARHYCQSREIILISERILPNKNVRNEADTKARYFIYVVLHEVAHAIKKHKSPIFDNLTREECETQEKEADELAMSWFNNHVKMRNIEGLLPITRSEIKIEQEKSQKLMKKLNDGTLQAN